MRSRNHFYSSLYFPSLPQNASNICFKNSKFSWYNTKNTDAKLMFKFINFLIHHVVDMDQHNSNDFFSEEILAQMRA